jgi:CHAT domain-containing protein
LKQTDQQHNISQFSNLTFRAVSLFLADSEDTYSTVQLLEVGRGILANLQLEIRSDVSNLLTSHPILAQQFQDLRDQIDSPFVMNSLLTSEPPNTLISVNQRRKLVKQFDDLLTSIRSLDGFENFLRGPSKSELYRLAEQGPIVVFNISDIRSDAFLITTKEIRSVHLPFLRSDSVKDLARMNLRNLRLRKLNSTDAEAQEGTVETQPDRDDDMNRKARPPFPRSPEDATQITLKWLWDAAVNPVLTELGFLKPPEGVNWPHIWWVPSGLLTRLPLHAAGDYGKGTTFNTLDRVVSSYVPTLKSLLYAREKAITWSNNEDQAALLVAMPTTPHQNALPGARKEVKEIEALIANDISKTVMLQPTKREVLKCLPKCQIAHFACHGESDPNDPSQSRLLLEDWKKDPLSVADITALNLDNVRFAYLSACSAAENQVEDLIDEGIHLTGAFQLAGFPSVVGTLWHVSDEHSVTVAMEVYREMCKTSKKFNSGKAALALHLAVRNLKSERWENPLLWAPYIHMGV